MPSFLDSQKGRQMSLTRRELCVLLPVAFVPTRLMGEDQPQKDQIIPSTMFPFDKMAVQTSDQGEVRAVFKGKLATGETVEVHQTTLLPGATLHLPHRHVHSEMCLIREGTVEVTVNGKSTRMGPGSVGFFHSNDEHGVKNLGTTPATYFIVNIGPTAGTS
jgi:quercetin dioxygenase-like cupin family protein